MHRILTWRKVSSCKIPDDNQVIVFDDKGYIGYRHNEISLWKTDYNKDSYNPTATHWAHLSAILEHEDIKDAIKNLAIKDIQDNHLI